MLRGGVYDCNQQLDVLSPLWGTLILLLYEVHHIFCDYSRALSLQVSAKWDTLAVILGDFGWNEWLGQTRATNLCGICERFAMKLSNTLAKSEIVFYEMSPSACSSAPPQNGIIQPCRGTRGQAVFSVHQLLCPSIASSPLEGHLRTALRYVFFTGRPFPPPEDTLSPT